MTSSEQGEPHHLFFGAGVNRPSRSEHLWILTQLACGAEIPSPRNYVEILERICALSVYSTAAPSTPTTRSPTSTTSRSLHPFPSDGP